MTDQVSEWLMAPIPGYDCRAVFFSDGRAEFFDEPARHRENDAGSTVRKVAFMLFEETDRHLSDDVCRYTHPFRVPLGVLERVVAVTQKIVLSAEGELLSDISTEDQTEIDATLNAIFWSEINPLLTTPLVRPNTDGRSAA